MCRPCRGGESSGEERTGESLGWGEFDGGRAGERGRYVIELERGRYVVEPA